MNETLTVKNLRAIKNAMDKISEIDKSDYFKNYYSEVIARIEEQKELETRKNNK